MLTNQEKLDYALEKVRLIVDKVVTIYRHNKHAIDGNEDLLKDFMEFKRIADRTIYRLEHPVLPIAMVGTTSAGKSTIVNAFLGRKVAPMEQVEMSAGVMRMFHSDQTSLFVGATENAKWETGPIQCESDAEIYDRIKEIFTMYHRNTSIAAPQIKVGGPIEWQTNRSILDLPDNLQVEFIDLPGLKTIQDPKNLAIIQTMLSKALCIVAMDFTDVDEKRIQRLLGEVKDLVKSLNNNTEFLIFLLNKVDNEKAEQTKAEEKILNLQQLIKETLVLPESKTIFPFIGQLMYFIQMGVKRDLCSGAITGYDNKYLNYIFSDIGSIFYQKLKKNEISKEEYYLSEDIKKWSMENEAIPLDKISDFYDLCVKLSSAERLYAELKSRIKKSFSQIVIRPALVDFQRYLDKLISDLRVYIDINRKSSVMELIGEKLGILDGRVFLEGTKDEAAFNKALSSVGEITMMLSKIEKQIESKDAKGYNSGRRIIEQQLTKVSNKIQERNEGYIEVHMRLIARSLSEIAGALSKISYDIEIMEYLESESVKSNRAHTVFNGFSAIPYNIGKSLTSNYIDVIRMMISEGKNYGAFIEKMSTRMSVSLAQEFGEVYKRLENLFSELRKAGFTKDGNFYKRKLKFELSDVLKRNILNEYVKINYQVREVLSKLANIEFQKVADEMIGNLEKYFKDEFKRLLESIQAKTNMLSENISNSIISSFAVSRASITLPDELFNFTKPRDVVNRVREKTGVRSYIDYGLCCNHTKHEAVYSNYYEYSYDNEIECHRRWRMGVTESVSTFWMVIRDWMSKQATIYESDLRRIMEQVLDMIEEMSDERLRTIQLKNANNSDRLVEMDMNLKEINEIVNNIIVE